jgi:hypothetical protein
MSDYPQCGDEGYATQRTKGPWEAECKNEYCDVIVFEAGGA